RASRSPSFQTRSASALLLKSASDAGANGCKNNLKSSTITASTLPTPTPKLSSSTTSKAFCSVTYHQLQRSTQQKKDLLNGRHPLRPVIGPRFALSSPARMFFELGFRLLQGGICTHETQHRGVHCLSSSFIADCGL